MRLSEGEMQALARHGYELYYQHIRQVFVQGFTTLHTVHTIHAASACRGYTLLECRLFDRCEAEGRTERQKERRELRRKEKDKHIHEKEI